VTVLISIPNVTVSDLHPELDNPLIFLFSSFSYKCRTLPYTGQRHFYFTSLTFSIPSPPY